ncbi:MAG: glycosyltransferase [Gammaproteobacteria bacterium]|nr:glycosyltransferase [Gammaproteobacteria bacterium]
MHVVHLETGRHVYGGARQVLWLARGLQGRGVGTTVVCPQASDFVFHAGRAGLAVRALPMAGDLDLPFVGRFAGLLRELQPDLLHVHSRRGADWMGGMAACRVGLPAVLSRRVDRPERRVTARFRYRSYSRVIAISRAILQQLEGAGVSARRLALIRSAVEPALSDPNWTRERLCREYGLDPRVLLVGCVAQLIPRKGHELLLRAWRLILRECPTARLLLFGQGALESELRRQVRRLGIGHSVVFAGFRTDLPSFLGRLDLVVHAALEEGLGLALLEAQAAAVPVVAFRAGGVPETIADGRTGYLVKAGDIEALAIAVSELLQNEERRRAFAEAAWQWAAREFRVADMVEAHLTLYGEVLETRPP